MHYDNAHSADPSVGSIRPEFLYYARKQLDELMAYSRKANNDLETACMKMSELRTSFDAMRQRYTQ